MDVMHQRGPGDLEAPGDERVGRPVPEEIEDLRNPAVELAFAEASLGPAQDDALGLLRREGLPRPLGHEVPLELREEGEGWTMARNTGCAP